MHSATPGIFRFAPSPNGLLHLGHAYSALLNDRLARDCGGRLLLRIEDIDTVRALPAFEAAIFEDLGWLGLQWETPVRRQSAHFDDYARALDRLTYLFKHPALPFPIDGASSRSDRGSNSRRQSPRALRRRT